MIRLKTSAMIGAAVLATATMSGAAGAQSTGLEDMVGSRAGQAEGEVQRRGYVTVRSERGDDRTYTYWWSADRRQCVSIATMDGRYASVQPTLPPDCRQPANVRPNRNYGEQPAVRPRPGYEPDPAFGRPPYQPAVPPRPGYQPDPGFGRLPYPPGGERPVIEGRPVELGLVCFGDGSRDGIASGTTWTWNSKRDRYEYGRYSETRPKSFDASLMIQTWPGGGRIRLPRALIPPLNSRGNNGWWDLYDVSVGPDIIRGTYRLNGLNKPRVTIDRRNGRITVQGTASYGFRGTCDLIGHEARRF